MSGPRDLLVRYTFENPERAAAELRVALPPFVVAQVDWKSLKAERNSVVDPEHQFQVYRWMALRLLSYVVRQLEHWRREHSDNKAAMVDMLKSLVGMQRAEELMGTLVEKYFEKGRQKGGGEGVALGLEKGRAEGR